MSQNNPNRQGFYTAHLVDGSKCVAEWKELAKGQGKQWWVYTSEDPTVEKKPTPLKNVVSFTKVSQAEVAEALRREPTVAEKISKSYEETYAQFLRHNSAPPPFPERRRLYLGDEVFVGALQDAKVVALHEGGRVVTVQYKNDSRSSREKGSATIPDLSHYTAAWHHFCKKSLRKSKDPVLSDDTLYRKLHVTTRPLGEVVGMRIERDLNDNPEYQRGYSWTDADKDKFLESVFNGGQLGLFIIVHNPYPKDRDLLDGKQRLQAASEFLLSLRPYRGLYWEELSPLDQHTFESRAVSVAEVEGSSLKRSELLRLFLMVNIGGVPQTAEHIDKVTALYEQALKDEAPVPG